MSLLLPIFGYNALHQQIMFDKLLYLILVSFHYNSLIIINHVRISVCTDYIPLLKVNFLHVRNFTDWTIFSCGACYRCISTDILPATWHCAGPGYPSVCTTDCWSASNGIKKLQTETLALTQGPETKTLSVVCNTSHPR